MASPQSETAPRNGRRQRLLLIAGTVFILAGLAYGAYWVKYLRHFERTDDAYVQGNLVQITPQVAGTVVAVNADDTDFVKAGQALVMLDRADAQVAVEQAQAALAQTVREVRGLYVTNSTWAANIEQREADVTRANADLARAQDDLARRQSLADTGAVSGEEMNHAQTSVSNARAALAAAQAALASARQQLATNQTLTEGTSVEKHPNVERAAARVREAYLAYARTELPSPVSGYVAKRTVQLGQRVAAGTPLMSIVPLDEVWVDANFKEVQLRRMRIGQPVRLTADAYGSAVQYDGRIVGLGVGTGGAFALLPAQNATGNWIKVVQRLPVRIALDPKELAEHPLRVGLSMEVAVNVADTSGTSLAEAPRGSVAYTTNAFAHDAEEADALVKKTIAENLGRSALGTLAGPVALAQRTPPARGTNTPAHLRSATVRSARAPL
ncbi:MAG TPA: HlyD family efflux transporter periplasmic adaptor subunit [Casimicrobiaceae bacterium]|nr:HlyD family efflux transporter periplasmic adaptor subunit [Casimicrobiaceae bacterium]